MNECQNLISGIALGDLKRISENGAMIALYLLPFSGLNGIGNKLTHNASLASKSNVLMSGLIINDITQNQTK